MADAWPCYRLIAEKWSTPSELEMMDMCEVARLNDTLDAWQAAEREAYRRQAGLVIPWK